MTIANNASADTNGRGGGEKTKPTGQTLPLTFIEILDRVAGIQDRGFTFLNNKLEAEVWPYAKLRAEAYRRGSVMRQLGLEKGDRLAMMIPDSRDFILSFFAAVTAGIVPVPMYPPQMLDNMEPYLANAARILSTAGAKMLLVSDHLEERLLPLVSVLDELQGCLTICELAEEPGNTDIAPILISADDICFLQFTSGSTSDPKGVVITHGNLCANTRAITHYGLVTDPHKDLAVSWLPMFHDMGLIGFALAPVLARVNVVILPTLTFVRRPHVWLSTISNYRATLTFAPNFAFALAAKRSRNIDQLDLSCLRILGCGAEPINPQTLRHFWEVFRPAGLRTTALLPCYGMAEATLAVTFGRLDAPMKTITIDRTIYETQNLAVPIEGHQGDGSGIELVSCGTSFPDHRVAILGEDGSPQKEGAVGEVCFSGPSVGKGYFQNPEATRVLLRGGWLHTGDLGFMVDGELYISGRIKDVIIINGRNYYPQEIEWEVETLAGIRQGNVVAFAIAGRDTEALIIVAETKAKEKAALEDNIRNRIIAVFGLDPKAVLLVKARTLPKTSSGKLQRQKTRTQYEAGRYD